MLSLGEVLTALPDRLQKVFEDSRVTELMINSPDSVWYERDGCLYPVPTHGLTQRDLKATAMRIARPLGLDADKRASIVDARLPDGSRVAVAGLPSPKPTLSRSGASVPGPGRPICWSRPALCPARSWSSPGGL